MRYWDTSAILPLLVTELSTVELTALFDADPAVVTWWATGVECESGLARREREGVLGSDAVREAVARLEALGLSWIEVQPSARLRQTAVRLIRTHPLRAGDALQLAAAIVAADGDPRTLPFVTLDDRLALAAEREGFPVIRPGSSAPPGAV